jgi:hypothetical protein
MMIIYNSFSDKCLVTLGEHDLYHICFAQASVNMKLSKLLLYTAESVQMFVSLSSGGRNLNLPGNQSI